MEKPVDNSFGNDVANTEWLPATLSACSNEVQTAIADYLWRHYGVEAARVGLIWIAADSA